MRIFLSAIVVILGVNLLIDLMDSNLVDVMKDRNETIQRQIDQMWQSARCPLFSPQGRKPCILKESKQTNQMRKIETQMIAAVHGNKNWSSGNTQVVTNDGVSTVYLHGTKSPWLMTTAWRFSTADGNQTPQNPALMHSALSSVLLAKVYSRKIFSGMFASSSDVLTDKMSTRPKISPTVMYSPEG